MALHTGLVETANGRHEDSATVAASELRALGKVKVKRQARAVTSLESRAQGIRVLERKESSFHRI